MVRDFTERVRQQSLGAEVLASLTPEQHFIKIVRAELTPLMGGQAVELNLSATPPVVIMLVGLQGAGKTTTVAKLAPLSEDAAQPHAVPGARRRLPPGRHRAADDARRAGRRAGASDAGRQPIRSRSVATRASRRRRTAPATSCCIDTAGRLHIDDELMAELERIRAAVDPHQILLVVDAMTGQDAVNVAKRLPRPRCRSAASS